MESVLFILRLGLLINNENDEDKRDINNNNVRVYECYGWFFSRFFFWRGGIVFFVEMVKLR